MIEQDDISHHQMSQSQ